MLRDPHTLDLSGMAVVCGCGSGDGARAAAALSTARRAALDADGIHAVANDASLRALRAARAAAPPRC